MARGNYAPNKEKGKRVRKLNQHQQNERLARRMALEHVNECRAADGFVPLKRISRLWWQIYGNDWRDRARKAGAK